MGARMDAESRSGMGIPTYKGTEADVATKHQQFHLLVEDHSPMAPAEVALWTHVRGVIIT